MTLVQTLQGHPRAEEGGLGTDTRIPSFWPLPLLVHPEEPWRVEGSGRVLGGWRLVLSTALSLCLKQKSSDSLVLGVPHQLGKKLEENMCGMPCCVSGRQDGYL